MLIAKFSGARGHGRRPHGHPGQVLLLMIFGAPLARHGG
jgi:hypothetical protein